MDETERNKAVIQRVFDEIVNEGRYDLIPELYAEDMIDHDPLPGAPPGRSAIRHSIQAMRGGFPDLQVTIEELVAVDDRVAQRAVWRGTNVGPIMGFPPTGKKAEWDSMLFWRLRDGKITERWATMDVLGMVMQLGAMPMPGPKVLAIAVPVASGQLEAWYQMQSEITGPRRRDYEASRRRLGIKREIVWHQPTPDVDLAVTFLEGDNLARALQELGTSEQPFDNWFRAQQADLLGIDYTQPPASMPQKLLDWEA